MSLEMLLQSTGLLVWSVGWGTGGRVCVSLEILFWSAGLPWAKLEFPGVYGRCVGELVIVCAPLEILFWSAGLPWVKVEFRGARACMVGVLGKG